MSKYAPLREFLRRQRTSFVPMTFGEIEKVLGTTLPDSQKHRAWWSNNPSNNVMTQYWLEAGFVTEQVDITGRKLVFRRTEAIPQSTTDAQIENATVAGEDSPHPFFGWMKGTVHVPAGVDLTEPADPEWGANVQR
jgi:YD repeat-containing protein